MTTDERLERLERAVDSLATTLTRNYPLRGSTASIAAVKSIEREVRAIEDAEARGLRADEIRAELAELEAVK